MLELRDGEDGGIVLPTKALLVHVALVFYFLGISSGMVSFFCFPSFTTFCFFWTKGTGYVSFLRFLKTKEVLSLVSLKSLSFWFIDFCSTSFLGLFLEEAVFGCTSVGTGRGRVDTTSSVRSNLKALSF